MTENPRELPDKARTFVRSAAFASYAAGLLAAYELDVRALPEAARPGRRAAYKARLARDALALLGVRWSIEGAIPSDRKPRLLVANHRSALDIPLLLTQLDVTMLSRADVAEWPVLGRLARHAGTIFVDRKSRTSGVKALRQVHSALERGETVCIFPEGTTLPGDVVRPFSPGAFAGVRALGVEILPVGIAYERGVEWTEPTFGAHLAKVAARPATRVHVVVGTPLRIEGRADRIAEASRDEVQALVHVARSRLGGR